MGSTICSKILPFLPITATRRLESVLACQCLSLPPLCKSLSCPPPRLGFSMDLRMNALRKNRRPHVRVPIDGAPNSRDPEVFVKISETNLMCSSFPKKKFEWEYVLESTQRPMTSETKWQGCPSDDRLRFEKKVVSIPLGSLRRCVKNIAIL